MYKRGGSGTSCCVYPLHPPTAELESAVQQPTKEWISQDKKPVVDFNGDAESSDDDGDGLLSSGLFKVKESSQKISMEKPSGVCIWLLEFASLICS